LSSQEDITRLLADLSAGKKGADEALLPLVYKELHNLAKHYMKQERADHTLQTTALVHEAFLRLNGGKDTTWESRAHFIRLAARAMRRVLIDHARHKNTQKKGGGRSKRSLDELVLPVEASSIDLLALDSALEKLTAFDANLVQIVELLFFGGMTVNETAEVLGVSRRTVFRDWRTARSWLKLEIEPNKESGCQ